MSFMKKINALKTSESACCGRKRKVLPVEEGQEEMILPVSLTQPKAGRTFTHMLYWLLCNLLEGALKDESGDSGPALPFICCAVLNGPPFAHL